jgi:16S rRNA G966 N2-methylase RsmD
MSGELSYSDLNLDSWRDYGDVETDSLWIINSRDKSGGHRLEYHGNCVPQIVNQLLRRYTKPNDIVIDLFEGSGTSAIEAARLNRRLVGVDIQPELVSAVNNRLVELAIPPEQCRVIAGNSGDTAWAIPALLKQLSVWKAHMAQFVFLHPPYADIIKFSDIPGDLSNIQSVDQFNALFGEVAKTAFALLEPGRFAAVVIGDCYQGGEWIPLGFHCLQAMNNAGFKTKSIVVKNITGNEKGKGNRQNLWRYRALKGGFYVFKHEYILIVQKPHWPKKTKKLLLASDE